MDVFIETADGKMGRLRDHVLEDKKPRRDLEPRPDLCPLYSIGLNNEPKRSEIAWHSKPCLMRHPDSTEILYGAR